MAIHNMYYIWLERDSSLGDSLRDSKVSKYPIGVKIISMIMNMPNSFFFFRRLFRARGKVGSLFRGACQVKPFIRPCIIYIF